MPKFPTCLPPRPAHPFHGPMVSPSPPQDYFCYYCYKHKTYCKYCNYAPSQIYYAMYYTGYYSTYYTEYYREFFDRKLSSEAAYRRARKQLDESKP